MVERLQSGGPSVAVLRSDEVSGMCSQRTNGYLLCSCQNSWLLVQPKHKKILPDSERFNTERYAVTHVASGRLFKEGMRRPQVQGSVA